MYAYTGAKLFQSIEEKNEELAKGSLIESKHHFLDLVKTGIGSPLVDQKNWTKMVDRLLNYYVEDLATAASHGVDITDVTQHEYQSERKWDFWGSLFYAGTVFTTIGYGNFAPVTTEGKVATIVYGTVGIPLCLILLADLGNLITKIIKFFVKKIKKHLYVGSKKNLRDQWPPQDEIDSMTGKSSFVVLSFICILYFCCGAFMYKTWEDDWTYLDAVYFIFVSTSTIGFGDVLPSQPKKFIFTSIYIFIGLSLLSSGFTMIQELLESRISGAKRDLDCVLGIEKKEGESIHSTPASPEPTSSVRSSKHEGATSTTADMSQSVVDNQPQEVITTTLTQNMPVQPSPMPVVEETVTAQHDSSSLQAAPPSKRPENVRFKAKEFENNNLFFAPNSRYEESMKPSTRLRKPLATTWLGTANSANSSTSGDVKVNETKIVNLDDGVLSVEATIVLD
ncbi:hypothetical protein EB796_001715 [Bugula neritina]|uniref:Potassium channel domain-containing protein n=1 Tax=Bugula neritina TaxID=10212 RepID=A0A7J7KPF2_BUGNE|nr:hypothetical protein EB796_001715 [Bugula neritina]